jgi:hypothetical protein
MPCPYLKEKFFAKYLCTAATPEERLPGEKVMKLCLLEEPTPAWEKCELYVAKKRG